MTATFSVINSGLERSNVLKASLKFISRVAMSVIIFTSFAIKLEKNLGQSLRAMNKNY